MAPIVISKSQNCLAIPFPDEGNQLVRKASQQDAHPVPSLRQGGVPHPEENLRALRLPSGKDQEVQLVRMTVNLDPEVGSYGVGSLMIRSALD